VVWFGKFEKGQVWCGLVSLEKRQVWIAKYFEKSVVSHIKRPTMVYNVKTVTTIEGKIFDNFPVYVNVKPIILIC
jgi:hypothetical protein